MCHCQKWMAWERFLFFCFSLALSPSLMGSIFAQWFLDACIAAETTPARCLRLKPIQWLLRCHHKGPARLVPGHAAMDSFESLARLSDTLHNRICLLGNRQFMAGLAGLLVCKNFFDCALPQDIIFPPPAKCQKLGQTDTVVSLFGVPTLKAFNG